MSMLGVKGESKIFCMAKVNGEVCVNEVIVIYIKVNEVNVSEVRSNEVKVSDISYS